uniref:Hypothetical transmembrane protein n=1 Tax=Spiroplasma citri TaxID=2133 RepID=Q6XK10_SPICI|nr:unknown [Spiroplasma citri]CAK99798.1 hypothetical transmembrane protein [Spiroplasma citri]
MIILIFIFIFLQNQILNTLAEKLLIFLFFKKSILTVITNHDLGKLPNNDCETILARLRERNPSVDIKQIIVTFVSYNQDGSQSWKISLRLNSIYYGSNNIRSANNYEIWNN